MVLESDLFEVKSNGKVVVNREALHKTQGYKQQIEALKELEERMRKSWNELQQERLESERVRAEMKKRSRELEREATRMLKEAEVQKQFRLDSGDE